MGKILSRFELANVWLIFVCLTNNESYMAVIFKKFVMATSGYIQDASNLQNDSYGIYNHIGNFHALITNCTIPPKIVLYPPD